MPSFIAKQIPDETIHRQKFQQRQTKVSTMDKLTYDEPTSKSLCSNVPLLNREMTPQWWACSDHSTHKNEAPPVGGSKWSNLLKSKIPMSGGGGGGGGGGREGAGWWNQLSTFYAEFKFAKIQNSHVW